MCRCVKLPAHGCNASSGKNRNVLPARAQADPRTACLGAHRRRQSQTRGVAHQVLKRPRGDRRAGPFSVGTGSAPNFSRTWLTPPRLGAVPTRDLLTSGGLGLG